MTHNDDPPEGPPAPMAPMAPMAPTPAPRGKMLLSTGPLLFSENDAAPLAQHVALSLRCKAVDLADGLNEAALVYFTAARREAAGNASDFAEWSDRVAKTSAAFLRALGVDPDPPKVDPDRPMPALLPLAAYAALCSRPGALTATRYSAGLDLMGTLERAVFGVKFTHDLAAHAAGYYSSQKRTPQTAAKKGLSARQAFVIKLAHVFETCFGARFPSAPHADESPFLRFAMKAFAIVKERTTRESEAITMPDDGADYDAAQALVLPNPSHTEQRVADDVRKVFPIYQKRKAKLAAGAPGESIDNPLE